jgi:hypothetical protein
VVRLRARPLLALVALVALVPQQAPATGRCGLAIVTVYGDGASPGTVYWLHYEGDDRAEDWIYAESGARPGPDRGGPHVVLGDLWRQDTACASPPAVQDLLLY